MSLIKVNKNENPYDVIGNYIEKHVSVIDNVIAVISINGEIHNELFLIENSFTNSFIWEMDWWEGEENVELIDFFFVSDACKKYNNNDFISRQSAIDTLRKKQDNGKGDMSRFYNTIIQHDIEAIEQLSSIQFQPWEVLTIQAILPQSDIIRCKDCTWWINQKDNPRGRCALFQIYSTGDWFCGSAERREE